jgi:lysophospholipase L1-like esterase
MGYQIAGPALFPLLYAQGRLVRRRALRLPEPAGARTGFVAGEPAAADPAWDAPLRLLVVGDSAAAGVGAASQAEALVGRVAAELARGGPVAWRLVARTGATAAGTRRHLAGLAAEPCDVAVTSLGLNDVTAGRPLGDALADVAATAEMLRDRFGARRVVVSGVPPLGRFPAVPQPLRWYLGRRAAALDTAVAAWAAGRPWVEHLPLDFALDVSHLAADGFHPGPAVYAEWGRAVAARVRAALG